MKRIKRKGMERGKAEKLKAIECQKGGRKKGRRGGRGVEERKKERRQGLQTVGSLKCH